MSRPSVQPGPLAHLQQELPVDRFLFTFPFGVVANDLRGFAAGASHVAEAEVEDDAMEVDLDIYVIEFDAEDSEEYRVEDGVEDVIMLEVEHEHVPITAAAAPAATPAACSFFRSVLPEPEPIWYGKFLDYVPGWGIVQNDLSKFAPAPLVSSVEAVDELLVDLSEPEVEAAKPASTHDELSEVCLYAPSVQVQR
jgi:hypothetical protein